VTGHYYIPEDHVLAASKEEKSDVAYVSQTAWLMNATIRDNILFGDKYDEERYNKVLSVCALKRDLENFKGGDLTEIGEKGVNLSGGQKQRVSLGIFKLLILARAAYSMAPIVLLDDPLSAVDAPTAKHLFNKCILGLFKGRTVILVSHAVALVAPQADFLVVVKNGSVVSAGKPDDILDNPTIIDALKKEEKHVPVVEMEQKDEKKVAFVEVETKASGSVKLGTYWTYISACGGWIFVIGVLGIYSFQIGSEFLSNWWVKVWTDSIHGSSDLYNVLEITKSESIYYISIYGLIGVIELLTLQLRFIVFLLRNSDSIFQWSECLS
jgi:ABC-type phosphate transport system ATPase subunit